MKFIKGFTVYTAALFLSCAAISPASAKVIAEVPTAGALLSEAATFDRESGAEEARALNFDPADDAADDEADQKNPSSWESITSSSESTPQTYAKSASRLKIDINLSTWRLRVLYYGQLLANGESVISYGTKSHPTPTGHYRITFIDRDAYSAKYKAKMPFAVFFIGGKYGIHAGDVSGRSHGCIRVPYLFAEQLYAFVQKNGQSNFGIHIHY